MTGTGDQKLSILVAEDSRDLLSVITATLESQGHQVVGVTDGKEAEKALGRRRFDVVVSDVIMPEADGLDLLRAVKSLQPEARVVMISGGGYYSTAKANLAVAVKLGAHCILEKPFAPIDLLNAVADVMKD